MLAGPHVGVTAEDGSEDGSEDRSKSSSSSSENGCEGAAESDKGDQEDGEGAEFLRNAGSEGEDEAADKSEGEDGAPPVPHNIPTGDGGGTMALQLAVARTPPHLASQDRIVKRLWTGCVGYLEH